VESKGSVMESLNYLQKRIYTLKDDMTLYHSCMVDAGDDMTLRGVYINKMESAKIEKEELEAEFKFINDLVNGIDKVIEYYNDESEVFDDMETQSAPSGEWEEYNYPYMIQENSVNTLDTVLDMFGIESVDSEED
jgi:hypothetical protein